MDKFSQKRASEPAPPPSPEMDAGAFELAFKSRSKSTPQVDKISPSAEVMEAANTVFEHHDEQADYDAIEDLAGDLLDESEPHAANQMLEPTESTGSRTVRHERKAPEPKQDEDIDLDL